MILMPSLQRINSLKQKAKTWKSKAEPKTERRLCLGQDAQKPDKTFASIHQGETVICGNATLQPEQADRR